MSIQSQISSIQALSNLGNGLGLLYSTLPDGATIVNCWDNTPNGEIDFRRNALISAPLAGEITGFGTIVFSGTNASITALTVNGLSIITGTVAAGANITATLQNVVNNINSTVTSPQYQALSDNNDTLLIAAVGQGQNANGYAVAIGTTMTTVVTPIEGGTNPSSSVDQTIGNRYFINANFTSSPIPTSLTGAIEITQYIVMRGMQGAQIIQPVTIANSVISPQRLALNMNLPTDTQGGAGTGTLTTILPIGFSFGDIVIITGVNAAHVITITTGGNIYLAAGNWVSGAADVTIELQYINVDGGSWQELSRTPYVPNVASQRAAGLPVPVSGVNVVALTNGGGTITVTPGVDKGYQVYNGSSLNLTSGQTIQINASPSTPYLDGDSMIFDYRATNNTASTQVVTIGGIALTTLQAQEGKTVVLAKYSLSNTTWYYTLIQNTSGIDIVSLVYGNTNYQPNFGYPTGNGQVPTFNTSGIDGGFAGFVAFPTPPPAGMILSYTTTQRLALTPTTALFVYDTTVGAYFEWDVNTSAWVMMPILEMISLVAIPTNQAIPLNTGHIFAGTGTNFTTLTPPIAYQIPDTTCFSYNIGTGVITILKTGYYNFNVVFHIGDNLTTEGLYAPGYISMRIHNTGSGNLGNEGNNIDFSTATVPSLSGSSPDTSGSLYIDLDCAAQGVYLTSGYQLQFDIFNRLAVAIPNDANHFSSIQISIQRTH